MCKHAMKFSAEKAGKRAKCSKCDAVLVIEAATEPAKKKEEEVAVAVEEPKPAAQADDDDNSAYGVWVDPEIAARQKELAEEEERKKKKKEKKLLPKVTRKVKAIHEAEAWTSVRTGMMLMLVGTVIWLFAHLLQGTYVLVGMAEFPEFGKMMARNLENRGNEMPEPGRGWDVKWLDVYLEMIAGQNFATFARVCLTLSTILYFLQAICWGIGYVLYCQVPRNYGMFGQTLTMMTLGFFNFVFMFCFKLLPVLGAHSYILIPFVTPEICMTEYNVERMVPIHVLWSGAPFWENMLNLLIRFCTYFEPAFAGIFLWSAGLSMKDDGVAKTGRGVVELCLGTLFILICFHLLSLCGASPVMVWVLRVIYVLWFFFLVLFLINYALALVKARAVLDLKINPTNELKEKKKPADDDDDDEDDD